MMTFLHPFFFEDESNLRMNGGAMRIDAKGNALSDHDD